MSGDVTIGALKRLTTLMAGQDIDSVDINGGVIDNVVIGGGTAEAGTFSTMTAATLAGIRAVTPFASTATDAITAAEHANRITVVTGTAAATLTLPEATGTGNIYTFIMGQVNTNGTIWVTADTTNAGLYGSVNILDVDSNAQTAYFTVTAGTTDTVTFDGTTKGGQIGDIITFIDIATDKWSVWGQLRCPAGSNVASCFSAAV